MKLHQDWTLLQFEQSLTLPAGKCGHSRPFGVPAMFRLTIALIAIAASTAAYGQTQSLAPLPPGRPADVKQAAIISVATENAIILGGAAAIIIGVAVVAAKHGSASSPASTSTSP
jgi:hypothetical protein